MGKYSYTKSEQERNKVLKFHQNRLSSIESQLDEIQRSGEERISESEKLLQELGYTLPVQTHIESNRTKKDDPIEVKEQWEEIVAQAEKSCPYDVEFEDLLTNQEFENAYRDLENINREFQRQTALTGIDATLLVTAAALQTIRWVMMPEIGERIDKAERITANEGDKLVKELKQQYVEKHSDWASDKATHGHRLREQEGKSWKEIIFSGVPYDAIKGTKKIMGVGLSGQTHRYRTLGHDPLLGWIFGTFNILTDTLTLNNLVSYRVMKGSVTEEMLLLPQLFSEVCEQIEGDKYKLPAAIFRQALHLQSDMYTKDGLPVPLLGVFNEEMAGELYSSQYDFLCFARDSKTLSISFLLSIFINMIIGLIHGLFYRPNEGSRELFEVRTRKILLYSNTLSASGNLAMSAITKNGKRLDFPGLLITVSRLYSDTRFIARAKERFIEESLHQELKKLDEEADAMLYGF